jgi:hypothetical protein
MTTLNVAREVALLQRLSVPKLRAKFAEGDLGERARRRGEELVRDADRWLDDRSRSVAQTRQRSLPCPFRPLTCLAPRSGSSHEPPREGPRRLSAAGSTPVPSGRRCPRPHAGRPRRRPR